MSHSSPTSRDAPTSEKLSLTTKLAYGAGDIGAGITSTIESFAFLIFLTNVAGLSAGLARTVLLVGSIPFGITFFLLWIVPQFSDDPNTNQVWLFWYYTIVFILFDTAYTTVNLPYTSLTPELTQDYDERTTLTSFRFAFSIGGSILALALSFAISSLFPEPEQQRGNFAETKGASNKLPLTFTRPPNLAQVAMKLLRQNQFLSHPLTILIFLVLTLVFVGFVLVRSPTFIIPPAVPATPVTVYVVDYGYHSRLILPNGEGRLIQYAYGDWRYFALNKQSLDNGITALLLPTQGTLGRRRLSNTELQRQQKANGQDTLLSFEVAGAEAAQLLEWLDIRFRQNLEMRVVNPRNHLTFVPDDQEYTLFHNSNHELVTWLETLGCQVEGFVTWPDFQIKHSNN